MVLYAIISWLVSFVTVIQVGGNINYFWEPWMASAVLSGYGLVQVYRWLRRTPIFVTALLILLQVYYFAPLLKANVGLFRRAYYRHRENSERAGRWQAFRQVLTGRRVLSTSPDIAVWSSVPEVPDWFLTTTLILRRTWDPAPIVRNLEDGVYEVIVGVPPAPRDQQYRQFDFWNPATLVRLDGRYEQFCVFDGNPVLLGPHVSVDLRRQLLMAACNRLPAGW